MKVVNKIRTSEAADILLTAMNGSEKIEIGGIYFVKSIDDQLISIDVVKEQFCVSLVEMVDEHYHFSFGILSDVGELNDWLSDVGNYKTMPTGRSGLKGLLVAKDMLFAVMSSMKKGEKIHVGWTDARRESAYRRLEKYGFIHEGHRYSYVK